MTTERQQAAPPASAGGAAPRRESAGSGAALTKKPPAAPDPKQARRAARRSRLYRWDVKYSPYGFISPFFLFFAAFGLFPLLYTGWASLHQVRLNTPGEMEWVGFENYTDLFESEFFWNALRNTFTIGIISTVPQLLIALGLAHLLNYKMRGSMFFRVAILTPYATSVAAAALVFGMLFAPEFGTINWMLNAVGIGDVEWEADKWPSQIAISVIVMWRWTGYNTLIYLAAMQSIPHDLYESASLDGASRWQQFRNVTLPSLRPTILFTIVVSTIGATQLFGEPMLFGGGDADGGAQGQYQTLGLYMYETGWVNQHLGRSAAIAWTMLLLLIVIGLIYWLLTRWAGRDLGGED
jgi:cellobiose transport system permease protein